MARTRQTAGRSTGGDNFSAPRRPKPHKPKNEDWNPKKKRGKGKKKSISDIGAAHLAHVIAEATKKQKTTRMTKWTNLKKTMIMMIKRPPPFQGKMMTIESYLQLIIENGHQEIKKMIIGNYRQGTRILKRYYHHPQMIN